MNCNFIARLTGETESRVTEIVERFGGIAPLLSADASRLRSESFSDAAIDAIQGVREAALTLLEARIAERPLLSSWEALQSYLSGAMACLAREEFRVLYLDNRNHLIANEAARGSVSEAPVYVREVIRRALELGASALIICHNHPSGDASPSAQDIKVTKELIAAAKLFQIVLHDHVIVATGGNVSLRATGQI